MKEKDNQFSMQCLNALLNENRKIKRFRNHKLAQITSPTMLLRNLIIFHPRIPSAAPFLRVASSPLARRSNARSFAHWNNRNSPSLPRWGNGTMRLPEFLGDSNEAALKVLIGLNCLVFLNWHFSFPLSYNASMEHLMASTKGVFWLKHYHTLLTSTVSHMEAYHLATNMIALYFFGTGVFQAIGTKKALGLYAMAGSLGALVQVWGGKDRRMDYHVLGASGAVSSYVVFNTFMNPRATVLVWMIFPVPMFAFGIFYVFQDMYGVQNGNRSRIGHEAHLTGAFIGGLAYFALRRRISPFRY